MADSDDGRGEAHQHADRPSRHDEARHDARDAGLDRRAVDEQAGGFAEPVACDFFAVVHLRLPDLEE